MEPLKFNCRTNEPYLSLPAPHENIIITPPRPTDAPFAIAHRNDPRINRWLQASPFPYLPEHEAAWFRATSDASRKIMKELQDLEAKGSQAEGIPAFVSGCPVRILREVGGGDVGWNGDDLFLGDL